MDRIIFYSEETKLYKKRYFILRLYVGEMDIQTNLIAYRPSRRSVQTLGNLYTFIRPLQVVRNIQPLMILLNQC